MRFLLRPVRRLVEHSSPVASPQVSTRPPLVVALRLGLRPPRTRRRSSPQGSPEDGPEPVLSKYVRHSRHHEAGEALGKKRGNETDVGPAHPGSVRLDPLLARATEQHARQSDEERDGRDDCVARFPSVAPTLSRKYVKAASFTEARIAMTDSRIREWMTSIR
jgi:hypothetical protein